MQVDNKNLTGTHMISGTVKITFNSCQHKIYKAEGSHI